MERKRPAWWIVVSLLLIPIAALGAMLMFGLRMPEGGFPAFDKARLGDDIEAYLAASESRHADIRPGDGKQVVRADPTARGKTPFAIVYLHGFSASPAELRPLPDRVAAGLGGNLFLTRLAGHGRSNEAMGEARLEDWLFDFSEALAIGEVLGDRVILMGTSTGASLATLALSDPKIASRVAAAVFISPNYGINSPGAFLLTTPVAAPLARLLIGPMRGFTPYNERHAAHWTSHYPTTALLPMAALVRLAAEGPVERIATPALFVYSRQDRVVRPDKVREVAGRWGGPHAVVEVGASGDPANHVIAGDIISPSTTERLAEDITGWLRSVPGLR